jgi:putative endonuclease
VSGKWKVASGRRAEERACRYLQDHGYRILGRNVRASRREIDIIARKNDTLVVVEVRSRKSRSSLLSSEIVGFAKRRRVAYAAREIIAAFREPGDSIRFDVIIVTTDDAGHVVDLDHIENAFSARGDVI